MLLPGSKGWINKYFSLINEDELKLNYAVQVEISAQEHLHLLSCKTGIVFGYPLRFVFFNKSDVTKWTESEKLKVLLFETLLLVYIQKNGVTDTIQEDFTNKLISYYSKYNTKNIQDLLLFWVKEDKFSQLENILTKRVDISKGFLNTRHWFSSTNNNLVYLDVILFERFLNHAENEALNSYSEYAYNVLVTIILAANSDGEIDEKEKQLFKAFLAVANLDNEYKEKASICLKCDVEFSHLTELVHTNKLFSRFLLDITILTVYGNQDVEIAELGFIKELLPVLGFNEYTIDESLTMIEHFILNSDAEVNLLSGKHSYEKVYDRVTSRWVKILLRNKDKLVNELSESKELVSLVKKSATQELTPEEKEKIKTQFFDVIKSAPSLAIFMLPGGAILLPLILKVIPALIPSSFRDNEVNK